MTCVACGKPIPLPTLDPFRCPGCRKATIVITPRDGLPSFFATGLAKALVGEQPCLLAPWVFAHLQIEKRPRDGSSLAQWKMNHTDRLHREVDRLKADGWTCTIERFFRLTGQTAILSGKPDIVAQKAECRPRIVDIKTGQERESDTAQVLCYMYALPIVWRAPYMQFEGQVVYPGHTVTIHPTAVDDFKSKLFALLKRLASQDRPEASPSVGSCRFCEVPESECSERITDAAPHDVRVTGDF